MRSNRRTVVDAIANLRRKQARRLARRNRERMLTAATTWLCGGLMVLCSIPAAVLLGIALAESARLMS